MKQYWKAILSLIVMALVYHFIAQYIPGNFSWFLTFLWCVILLVFGYMMSPTKKRNNHWLGKTILAIVILIIFSYRLDLINVSGFTQVLGLLGLTHEFLNLLLIFCGWAFFQV